MSSFEALIAYAAQKHPGTKREEVYPAWSRLGLSSWSDAVAFPLLDVALRTSVNRCARAMQRVAKVNVDGAIGPRTMKALTDMIRADADGTVSEIMVEAEGAKPVAIIDEPLMRAMFAGAGRSQDASVIGALQAAAGEFSIDTPERVVAWLANLGEESGCFSAAVENMNYSAQRACQVWPSKFPSLSRAQDIVDQGVEAFASYVYAGILGNGPAHTRDGWNFRGHGWIQLTGRVNIEPALAQFDGKPPAWLETDEGAALSAAYYIGRNNLNAYADVRAFETYVRRINAAAMNWATRVKFYNRGAAYLAIPTV